MRAVPEGIEWNWKEDGFVFVPYDRKDELGYSERRVNLYIGPRFPGRPLLGSHTGTEWREDEGGRMEPDTDFTSSWWGFPLFGWEVSLMVTDFS